MAEIGAKPLLIELGTEELPVKALAGLAQAFFDGVIDGLHKRGIAFDRDGAKPLYTPRRLTVLLPGVAGEQPELRRRLQAFRAAQTEAARAMTQELK